MKTVNEKEWISVDFALPDTTRWVWVYIKAKNQKMTGLTRIGYYDDEYWCFTDDTKITVGSVTHWQRLEKPAKP